MTKISGFSLSELLVSLSLSLLLMFLCVKIIVAAKVQAQYLQTIQYTNEDSMFLSHLLQHDIALAGFVKEKQYFQPIQWLDNNNGLIGFKISYVANDKSAQNCLGKKQKIVTNRYQITKNIDKKLYDLRCNGQVLVSGIESVLLMFGVDADHDGQLDAYINSSQFDEVNSILALRFDFILRSPEKVGPTEVLHVKRIDQTEQMFPADHYYRKQLVMTIPLPNQVLGYQNE